MSANQKPIRPPAGAVCIIVILGVLATTAVSAADAKDRFAVKGAGGVKCSDYVDAYDNKRAVLSTFGGWIDGFVTATNHYEPDLFDLAPWQTSDLLAYALTGFCRKNSELSFYQAMLALKTQLLRTGLKQASPAVVAEHAGKAVVVYAVVLKQIRERLVALGKLEKMPAVQGFDGATAQALRDYQSEAGIEQTGVPDQITVSHLLR